MANFCSQCGKPLDADGLPPDGCFEYPCPQRDSEAGPLTRRGEALPATGTARRMATSALDFVALLGILTVVDLVIVVGTTLFWWTGIGPALGVVADVATTLVLAGYWAVRDIDGGRWSLGKRLGRFAVVDAETGEQATTQQAILRNSYYILLILVAAIPFIPFGSASLILAVLGIDALVMFVSPKNQRLGDLLAGTQVVSR